MTTNPTAARAATISGLDTEPSTRSILRPTVIDVAPWWQHPEFCDKGDSCTGGEKLQFGPNGPTTVSHRTHSGVVLDDLIADLEGGSAAVLVEVTAIEDPTEGFLAPPAITIDLGGPLLADADIAERIARAILDAVAAARQPLPAVTDAAA